MPSLFPARSNPVAAVKMTASPTTSPAKGNNTSLLSPSLGSQPTENLAPPDLPSLEERSLSAASVASAAPSSGLVSAVEESLPRPADDLEPNNPFDYLAAPPFRHNWANPNRRAARGAVLGGALSGVVVSSHPRPAASFGAPAVSSVPVSPLPVLPDPASPLAPTRPPPPVPSSRSPPAVPLLPIPARNPARLGPTSPAVSSSAGDDKVPAAEKK